MDAAEYRDAFYAHAGVEIYDALSYFADLVKGPPVGPEPDLRANWHDMQCRKRDDVGEPLLSVPQTAGDLWKSDRCKCDHCARHAKNHHVRESWRMSEELRPHRQYAHPFGSVSAALEHFVWHRRDGVAARSPVGSITDRLEKGARLGTDVQVTVRQRDSLDVRKTDKAVDVERAITAACSVVGGQGEVSTAGACWLLVGSVDTVAPVKPADVCESLGCTEATAKRALRRARKQVKVELAARDLIPEPRDSERVAGEVTARRAELAQTRRREELGA